MSSFNAFYVAPCVLILALILSIVQKAVYNFKSPLRSIPGPWYAAWSNWELKYAVITGRRIHYVHSLHEKYGRFVRLSPNEVSISDPESVTTIHKINSGYVKSPWYIESTNLPRPILFSMSDVKAHATRRRVFARAFTKSHLRQTYESTVHSMIQKVVARMKSEAEHGTSDILKWWTFMATDVSALLMFGDSFKMIERGEVNEYIRILQSNLKGSGIGVEIPWIRGILKYIPIKSWQEVFNSTGLLMKYGLETRQMSRSSGDDKTIFSNSNKEAEREGGYMDEIDVQLEAQGLLVAGSDTTAVTLTYLVWAVICHPQWQHALEEEVAGLAPDFTDAELETLPVLNGVIEETLRLYGAAPGCLPRMVPPNGAHLKGHFLPEGTVVSTQSYTLHRDANVFPDPFKFDPGRWIPTKETIPGVSAATSTDVAKAMYSPFGFGSRTCLGIHMARMEMRLAVAEFFKTLPGIRLTSSVTENSMAMENYFLIAPASHRCEVTLKFNE